MLHELNSKDPAEWLRYARSDLAVAGIDPPSNVVFETLCYHTQQAAEKAVKAVLIAEGIDPPRTHDVRQLLDLLPPHIVPPVGSAVIAALTQYAVQARYPDDYSGEIEADEWREAVAVAQRAVDWAEALIGQR